MQRASHLENEYKRYDPQTKMETILVEQAFDFATKLRTATRHYLSNHPEEKPTEKKSKGVGLFDKAKKGIKKGLGMAHERQEQASVLNKLADDYLQHNEPFGVSLFGRVSGLLLVANVLNFLDLAYSDEQGNDLSNLPKSGSKLREWVDGMKVEEPVIAILAAVTGESKEVIQKNVKQSVKSGGKKGISMKDYIHAAGKDSLTPRNTQDGRLSL